MPDALLGCSTHFLAAPPRCLGMAREGRVGEPPDPDTIGAVAKVSTGVAAKKVMQGVAHGVVAKVLHGLAKVMHGLAAKVTIGVANRGGGDTWVSTGYRDPWLDNPAWKGESSGGKNKKEKSYLSCTYLGVGRQRLPHQDRRTLAGLVLDLIFQDTGIQIPMHSSFCWRVHSLARDCNKWCHEVRSSPWRQ